MRWTVEFSDEVLAWYQDLTPEGKAAVRRVLSRLEDGGHMLGMPLSRQLGGGLRELRFTCEGVARRITYVLDPGRRAVTLTTFRKQRQNERGEILRARRAQAARQATRTTAKKTRKKRKRP
ncbi:type II toxin-antitoxin system RelE/ParE family toxin [Actinomyces sp. 2119]|uniref:type II toxin-antitoxin system RelE/ParE family toxin n=1 Tax=Actinomyces sp. 2119 TaxID=2321393 RepID=UPI000E6BEBBE|nr:type II toxin-antitoxin system RelE/ParE family toxin [Actinomyces sp. 2119]RJF41386.1 type II toxin-antitoxin system RelE/ParE family toxin [Actinomyces sp. 2119]